MSRHKITNANIKEWAKNYDGELFDGILCDPPYELSNDGKASANRVFFEFMFPEYSNRNTETLSESELSLLIKQVLVLGLVADNPSVSTTMPVSTVTLDKHSLIREVDVKDSSELSEVVSKYDGTLNGNPELDEHIANIHFKLTDTSKLFKVLNEVGSGFYSGGIGVGFSITPTSLPSFLASSRAVVSAYESIGLSDDSFAELVLASCRTENETVLRFDLSGGLVNERSAITTLILFAVLDIAGSEFIRTYTATGSLPTKFKSTDIGFVSNATNRAYSINCIIHPLSIASVGFMGKEWDGSKVAFDVEMWADILKLLKPGGHLLAFSGSRTYHRMAVAIEDAGFEIRDQLIWMYGCLSEDTEILTVNGWKRYHKAILSDTVVCYNIDNDNYELHKPTDKFYYDNKHTAYRIKSDTTDQIVSRNHRVIVERNGRKVFAQAETLERQESVPVLESLSALPDTIHNPQQGSSITKQDLLKKVWQQDDSRKEQWQEAGKDTVSSLQGNVLPNGQKQEQPTQGMFKKVQRLLTRSRLEETRTQGQSQLETRKRTGTGNKNDWRNQSKLERWFDLSEQKRQVRKSSDKIRQMSERILGYGSDRRLCYGTPIASSAADWQTTNTLGVSTPRQSRRNRQSYRKLNAIQDERGTQEIRVGSRHNTTLATVEPIEYTGKVWCVTVPTGAFVARRNGQIFITGNSGFPKSLNIGKAVDKIQGNEREVTRIRTDGNKGGGANTYDDDSYVWDKPFEETKGTSEWEGYGTALKPAHEPCVLARKPLDGTVANNVLKHGTGGLNIDGCRVGYTDGTTEKQIRRKYTGNNEGNNSVTNNFGVKEIKMTSESTLTGRFPANLIHDGSDEVEAVFPQTGKSSGGRIGNKGSMINTMGNAFEKGDPGFGDSGSASRYFYCAKASKRERNAGLEGFENHKPMYESHRPNYENTKGIETPYAGAGRTGNANQNHHPTVKPLSLTKYLATLIKPPTGGRLLVPFSGSGSEMIGALQAGWEEVIGVELTEEYIPIAEARIKHWLAEAEKETTQAALL